MAGRLSLRSHTINERCSRFPLARIIHEGAEFSDSAGDRRVKPRCQGDTDEAEALRERNLTRTASTTRMRTALRP